MVLVTQPAVRSGQPSENDGGMKNLGKKVQPGWPYGTIGDLNWTRTSEKLEYESSLAENLVGV